MSVISIKQVFYIYISIDILHIKHMYLRLENWIYPGTFYGICAPHKLSLNQLL